MYELKQEIVKLRIEDLGYENLGQFIEDNELPRATIYRVINDNPSVKEKTVRLLADALYMDWRDIVYNEEAY